MLDYIVFHPKFTYFSPGIPKEPLFVKKSERALVIFDPNCFYIISYRVPVVLPFTIPTEL